MSRVIHRYVGPRQDRDDYVRVACGWDWVPRYRATMDYKRVTCPSCQGVLHAKPVEPGTVPAETCRRLIYHIGARRCSETWPMRTTLWCSGCKEANPR